MRKNLIALALTAFFFASAAEAVCNLRCNGGDWPGGPCYDGPGGPLYNGPGGPLYDGPGGPLYDGPGGALYDGPGGTCYNGPGGSCRNAECTRACQKMLKDLICQNIAGTISQYDYEDLQRKMYWTEVPGTGMNTRVFLLLISRNLDGTWTDPHTGFTSTDPDDFHIDHRMPFSEVARRWPQIYELPLEEQLSIYNDLDNLQVLHSEHNIEKGDQTAEEHVGTFRGYEARVAFQKKVWAYTRKMDARF